jgi:hypothetical protein
MVPVGSMLLGGDLPLIDNTILLEPSLLIEEVSSINEFIGYTEEKLSLN